jgi:hypothetical protein
MPHPIAITAAVWLTLAAGSAAQSPDVPRTSSGRPDLSGTYDIATLTGMERAESFGELMTLPADAAALFAERARQAAEFAARPSDPNRGAPPVGGSRDSGNAFWIEPGRGAFQIDGQWRTSILVDPPNGRYPPRVTDAPGRNRAQRRQFDGTADPPMLPSLANNYKRIVQSEDTIMILAETVHDARIIRMNAEHDPPEIRKWLGDSIGWWEDDILVVETTNFVDDPLFREGTGSMTVGEWFWFDSTNTLIYTFEVRDPTVWTAPFTGEYAWPHSQNKLYEFACHEGNYPLAGIMKGARFLEAEFRGEAPTGIENPTR